MSCEEKPVRKLSDSSVACQEAILKAQGREAAGVDEGDRHMGVETGLRRKDQKDLLI